MNNTARGVIFGIFLLGMLGLLYGSLVAVSADGADSHRAVTPLALGAVACAIIASGAMSGMTSSSGATRVTFGGRGEVQPGPGQPQPYAQPAPPYGSYAPHPGQQPPGHQTPGQHHPGQQTPGQQPPGQ
ncbi:hypothetical protein GCM10023085_38100 [Actinomadura viridis]|uniref:Uncharacterized protein n=1 Tax=Actinomadura viridis TaxID=58110 RepID=A0A931DG49_9ACTN|nr:hypothetical protein [Actinomadura viridis]MBG6087657.1 hypothetical protein [Actinomadura viridis]